MEIFVAKNAGFCFGVKRSVDMAEAALTPQSEVYILGQLVHNSQVIDKLKEKGIKLINSLDEIGDRSQALVLISAHGVPPVIYEDLKNKNLKFVDTTCPPVKKVQTLAKKLLDDEYTVVIIGDKGHTEVKGILGWAGNNAYVVEKESDIFNIPYSHKIGVVAQTTQSQEKFNELVVKLKSKAREVKVLNTICEATQERQAETLDLAQKVNIMLVIGDPRSANTKRLAELSSNTGTETHRIAGKDELDMNWIYGKKKIGITAGASTPDWVIEEIVEILKSI